MLDFQHCSVGSSVCWMGFKWICRHTHTRIHKKLTDFKSVSAVSFQYTLEPSSWIRIHTQVVALFRLSFFFFFFVCSFVARFLLNLALLFRRQFAFLAFNANLIVQRNTVANCIKRRSHCNFGECVLCHVWCFAVLLLLLLLFANRSFALMA